MLKIMHLYQNELDDGVSTLNSNKRVTVCYDSESGKLGLAYVHPKDTFSRKTGVEIAKQNMYIDCPRHLNKYYLFNYVKILYNSKGYFPDSWKPSNVYYVHKCKNCCE